MTKFAVFCAGTLLCAALLTGCGSQQHHTAIAEDTHAQQNLPYEAESSVPPAVRERPHLASALEEDWPS